MARSADNGTASELQRLTDENEQLRLSLEGALEENVVLLRQRDLLRGRMRELAREVREAHTALSDRKIDGDVAEPAVVLTNGSETEEELRAAFEELQIVTEELEVANTSLQQTNQALDERVAQRTLELEEIAAALQGMEASLRAVADLVPDLLWRADARGHIDWFNRRWLDYTGHASGDRRGMRWFDAIHPRDRDVTQTSWAVAVASGKPFEHEHRLRNLDGEYRWFLVRAEPQRDGKDRIVSWYAAGTDIHDRRIAMEALQQSEMRFRTLIESMPQLVWRAVFGGRWTWASAQWSGYTGQNDDRARGMGWLDAFHPDDRPEAKASWKRAATTGELELTGRIFHAAENRYRHFRTRAVPLRDPSGNRVLEWIGTSTDVDDLLQLQETQVVLVAELQHRTRNLMGVVQAVTTRTLRGATSLDEFEERIGDRFSALARVQGLLSKRDTGIRVPFDLLLREELSAHLDLSDQTAAGKVLLEGPPGIPLRSATVQTFALALHELATNAVKYGALSSDGGQLRVSWGLRRDDASELKLWVDWRETGVPISPGSGTSVQGRGYGRELIERALPYQLGACTSFKLARDGVHCTIEMTVPDEQATMETRNGR